MNTLKVIMMLAMAAFMLTGCLTRELEQVASHEQVNVFGIRLHSTDDYRELHGVEATEET